MDKKNVQNRKVKTLLTEKNTPYDLEKLWCQIKRKYKFCEHNFFIIFYSKNIF
jgi:hypothetical protein